MKKGWKLEGKKRFNEMFDQVQKDRDDVTSKQRGVGNKHTKISW